MIGNPKSDAHTKAFLLELITVVQFIQPWFRSGLTVSQSTGMGGYGTSSNDSRSGGGSYGGFYAWVGGRVIIGRSAVDVEACGAPVEGVDIAKITSKPVNSPDIQGVMLGMPLYP